MRFDPRSRAMRFLPRSVDYCLIRADPTPGSPSDRLKALSEHMKTAESIGDTDGLAPGFPHANPNSAILVSKLLCYDLSRRLFMRTRIRLVEHATVSYTSEVKWPNNLVSVNSKLPSDAIGQTIEESFTTTAACIGLKIQPQS